LNTEEERDDVPDLTPDEEAFRTAVLEGFSHHPKSIPSKFLYDARGSALFEQLTLQPDYYLTRTEIAILHERAADIAAAVGPHARLIEFGSGSSQKARMLLGALDRPAAYVPVDISCDHLRETAAGVAQDLRVTVIPLCADYTAPFELPTLPCPSGKRIGFFGGTTIGNFEPEAAEHFLARCAHILGSDSEMIIGVDLKKEPAILNAAYNDSAGVMAAFSLNILERIKRELGRDLDISRFKHLAFYNATEGRIEVYICSLADQPVRIAGQLFQLTAGERIQTVYSYKYSIPEFRALAARAGYKAIGMWTDPDHSYGVHHFRIL
jgi:L-histidine Nalpha-methyltransferase